MFYYKLKAVDETCSVYTGDCRRASGVMGFDETSEPPLTTNKDEVCAIRGGKKAVCADHRGQRAYLKGLPLKHKTIRELGPIPDEYTFEKPTDPKYQEYENGAYVLSGKRKRALCSELVEKYARIRDEDMTANFYHKEEPIELDAFDREYLRYVYDHRLEIAYPCTIKADESTEVVLSDAVEVADFYKAFFRHVNLVMDTYFEKIKALKEGKGKGKGNNKIKGTEELYKMLKEME